MILPHKYWQLLVIITSQLKMNQLMKKLKGTPTNPWDK
jgi:hypothetical protein